MRRLILGTAIGFLTASTLALALEVRLPPRTTPKSGLLVDELGNVLFGSMPARVQVVDQNAGEPWSAAVDAGAGQPSIAVATVPAGRRLVVTELDGAWACNGCQLRAGASLRLGWANDVGVRQRSYRDGVVFEPGETIMWTASAGGVSGTLALMGRLVPTS